MTDRNKHYKFHLVGTTEVLETKASKDEIEAIMTSATGWVNIIGNPRFIVNKANIAFIEEVE